MRGLVSDTKLPLVGLSLYQMLIERTVGVTEKCNNRLTHFCYVGKKNKKQMMIGLSTVDRSKLDTDTVRVHGHSWLIDKSFCLDTQDEYLLKQGYNVKRWHSDTLLITVCWFLFLITAAISVCNWIYTLLIPILENTPMADDMFVFLDDLLYYGQVILPIIVFVLPFVIIQTRSHRLRVITSELFEHYKDADMRERYEMTHDFYESCPSCGAPHYAGHKECVFCGTNLVKNKDEGVHKITLTKEISEVKDEPKIKFTKEW